MSAPESGYHILAPKAGGTPAPPRACGRPAGSACSLGARGRRGAIAWHYGSVPEGDELAGHGRDAIAGQEDADQVERVGGGKRHHLAARLALSGGAQALDGDGQSELLAEKAADEATAADLPPIFHAAEGHQELPPSRQVRLPGQQITKDDPVAPEKHLADGVDGLRPVLLAIPVQD